MTEKKEIPEKQLSNKDFLTLLHKILARWFQNRDSNERTIEKIIELNETWVNFGTADTRDKPLSDQTDVPKPNSRSKQDIPQ